MPTPNEHTVPSPERDEDLIQAIEDAAQEHARWDKHLGHSVINCGTTKDSGEHFDFAMKVAAFSARRAREKAIDEVFRYLKNSKGPDDWEDGMPWMAIETIEEKLNELKSPTN